MAERPDLTAFEAVVLPHLPAAYNLARWLLKDESDADDIVQDACIRSLRHFETFRGGDARGWLLTIVRNCCYTFLRKRRHEEPMTEILDEEQHDAAGPDPETLLVQGIQAERLGKLIEELPVAYREVLVLREIEGLSYKEIGSVTDLPIGTVMSRLSRARQRLQKALGAELSSERAPKGGSS